MYNVAVPADPRLVALVEKALAAGIPHDALAPVLTARGWSPKEIYDALATCYEQRAGIEIPSRPGSGTSAKDAFFYLLVFASLATWTLGFGSLGFALIDRWLADPLFSTYATASHTGAVTSGIAALLVAFPLYLFLSWLIAGETAAQPDKLESPIRKWLTYMALVIAASLFAGDLIVALAYLLRGELTSRFLGKSFIILLLSGGVFTWYFGGLRRPEITTAGRSGNLIAAGIASAAVLLMVSLGFLQLGSPRSQRALRADSQRVLDLYRLSNSISRYWDAHAAQLPASLAQLPGRGLADPVTHLPYEYHPNEGSQYQLCAQFARSSESQEIAFGANPWIHPAGRSCLTLDASVQPQPPGPLE